MAQQPRVAVVTGGSRGIGAAVARRLAAEGMTTVIIYQSNSERAAAVVNDITASGGVAIAIPADVAQSLDMRRAVRDVVERFGRIDVLVNCAGILEMHTINDLDATNIAEAFGVNFNGVVYAVQAALPHFPPEGGRIINFSSNLIYQPRVGTGLYAATKAAVSVLTNALAKELGPKGITVNAVAPSLTRTDMTSGTPPARLEAVAAATPLGRIGEPEDIAHIVAFLASSQSRWITGRTLLADGGLTDGL